eukprot:470457_1
MATQNLFKHYKQIKQETKDVFYGYIRNMKHNSCHTPMIIVYISLHYYIIKDFWSVYPPKSCTLNQSKDCITVTQPRTCSTYGNIIIENSLKGIYRWNIKVISTSDNYIYVGIDSSNKKRTYGKFIDVNSSDFYAVDNVGIPFCKGYYSGTSLCTVFKQNDVIGIEIDTHNGTFTLIKNYSQQRDIVFHNIDFNHNQFCLAASMECGDALQILDFHQFAVKE